MGNAIHAVVGIVAIAVGYVIDYYSAGLGTVIGNLFISYGLGQLASSLNGTPSTHNTGPAPWQFMANGSTYPSVMCYGATRSSGVVVFQATSGTKNQYLWTVLAISPWQIYDPNDD